MTITIVRRSGPLKLVEDRAPEVRENPQPARPATVGVRAVRAGRLEPIIGVAIRRPSDGMYWYAHKPYRHNAVIHGLVQNGVVNPVPADWEQGFVTSRLRFVTRLEAMEIAKATKQFKRKPGGYNGPELYSEDLW